MDNFRNPNDLNGSEPLRRRRRHIVTTDDDGNPVVKPVDANSIALSPEGAIDSSEIGFESYRHCGCPTTIPAGGRCAVDGCGRVSCERCAGRCANCMIPCCLEHSRFAAGTDGKPLRFCLRCDVELRRKTLFRKMRGFLFSPFVDRGGQRPHE